jgi:hypothetical protein
MHHEGGDALRMVLLLFRVEGGGVGLVVADLGGPKPK